MIKNAPLKTVLALATCAAILVAYRRYVDSTKGINPGIFQEARKLPPWPRRPLPPHTDDTDPQDAQKSKVHTHGNKPYVSNYFIDSSGNMSAFYARLHALELPPTAGVQPVVSVLHYGDSPTTADLITGDVRSMLQQRFGNAGDGFLLTAKPWAWYQHRGITLVDKGWNISTAVGKGHDEVYGLGGASFEGGTTASAHIVLEGTQQGSMEISYLSRPGGGELSVLANGTRVDSFSTASETAQPAWHTVTLPADAKTIDLKPVSGPVKLFGETFRTGKQGVLYNSLGLNGASTTVLSNGFNPDIWATELQHEQPMLVIINYGTNESSSGPYVDKQYEITLRASIRRVRNALPGVPVLVMSPMDRGRREGVDEIETYDTIPRIVAIQKRVAAELNCAFFDTFDAMGGDGTMARWYNGHPRLVAGDLIHPTPQGAAMVAQLLVKDLLTGYDHYLQQQTAAPATTTPQTEPVQTDQPPATPPTEPAPSQPVPAQPASPQPADVPPVTPASKPPEA